MTTDKTPTPEELETLARKHGATSYRNRADTQHPAYGFTEDGLRSLLADALAKWGQPAQETKGRKVFVCTHCDGVYADQPVTRCDCLPDENTFTEGWICFGAPAQAAEPVAWAFKYDDGTWHDPSTTEHSSGMRPLFAAPQPVARVPLTDGQKNAMWVAATIELPSPQNCYLRGMADAERAHGIGIKGGQHVE